MIRLLDYGQRWPYSATVMSKRHGRGTTRRGHVLSMFPLAWEIGADLERLASDDGDAFLVDGPPCGIA